MNRQYFRDVTTCVLVYDVTDNASFEDLEGWLVEFMQNCSGQYLNKKERS